ncbi:MAG: hypothetical protein AAFR56_03815 [Chloroflexota bacterium]
MNVVFRRLVSLMIVVIFAALMLAVQAAPLLPTMGAVSYAASMIGGTVEIHIMDVQTRVNHVLLKRPVEFQVDWSPDGRTLAYMPSPEGVIYTYDIFTQENAPVRNGEFFTDHITWSPNGDWLMFSTGAEIWAYNASTDTTARLHNPGDVTLLDWSPDGRYVVYTSRRRMDEGLYLLDLETRVDTLLKETEPDEFGVFAPSFSPDGCCIAYTVNGQTGFRSYRMNLRTQEITPIAPELNSSTPVYSPDGRFIALRGSPPAAQGFDIYMVHLASGRHRRLTNGPYNYSFPRWMPTYSGEQELPPPPDPWPLRGESR